MLLEKVGRDANGFLRPGLILKDAEGGPDAIPCVEPVIGHKAGCLAEKRDEALLDFPI